LQRKECSRKGPTIRIRVNLQGMDLSRKSRNGISKEQYLQGKELARKGISKERCWNMQGMDFARNADYVAQDSLITRTLYDLNIKCNLYLQIPICNSLLIPFIADSISHSNSITLQFPILADSSLSSLAFSVPCKFRTLPNRTLSFH